MAANSTITGFKSALTGGGARPNLFEVTITGPTGTSIPDNFSLLCKAAALPASNIAAIDVPFRGRILKVAGDRTFDTWTVTVINDENFAIRSVMESWMQFIAQYGDSSGASDPSSYMGSATVTQLKRSATTSTSEFGSGLTAAAAYDFAGIFPTNISAIDLSYDTSDTIEEFTVEFQVLYWKPKSATQAAAT